VHDEAVFRKGRISIGVSPSVARHHLLPVVSAHQKEHPELALEMHEAFAEGLYTQLAERRTDFAIGPGIAGRNDFHVRPIIKDPIVAVLPPDFPVDARGGVTLREISAQSQICMPRGTAIRQVIENTFKANKLPLRTRFEVMYPQGLFDLVAAGMGVAMMPLLSLPPTPHTFFKAAVLTDATMFREMCLITVKARKQSPAARKLAQRIVSALRAPAASTSAIFSVANNRRGIRTAGIFPSEK
jgi:DNA-binding transcriptional LysR family regulator